RVGPLAPGLLRVDGGAHVTAAGPWADPGHRRQGMDGGARGFREVKVVLDRGVLRPVAAAGEAFTAVQTGAAVGTDTTEERVGHARSGSGAVRAEDDADGGR